MEEHEAAFRIESKAEAHAVERLLERLYDSLREESRTVRSGTGDSAEMLEQFRVVRDSARRPRAGTLRVVLEQRDESFEGSR